MDHTSTTFGVETITETPTSTPTETLSQTPLPLSTKKPFTFNISERIEKILKLSDNGTILREGFWLLYIVSAGVMLITPLVMLATSVTLAKPYGAIVTGVTFVAWLVFAVNCFFNFKLWWTRGKDVKSLIKEGDEFVASPLVSNYIKVCGESCALFLALGGLPFMTVLGTLAAMPDPAMLISGFIGSLFLGIPLGYLCLLFSKCLAEWVLALAAIANNTKTAIKTPV